MFYRTGAIFATLKSSSSHAVKSIAVDNISSSTSRRKCSMRLRKVRWNIYQKIRLVDKDVKGVLGYYRSLIKRFLKRFSVKLKPREPTIWKEKLQKTVKDVNKFLREKSTPNSTSKANTVKSQVPSRSKSEKKENIPRNTQNVKNVKTHPQQKGTYYTIMAEYMSKMDSALLMVSTILYLVRNDQTKVKDEPFEVPAVETIDNDLTDVIEVADEPIVTVTEDEASVKKTVNNVVEEIAETRAEKTATTVEQAVNAYGVKVTWSVCPQLRHLPVSECRRRCEWDVIARRNVDPSYNEIRPVEKPEDKNSEEYKQRIKKASSNLFATSGVVHHKSCPAGFHVGVTVIDCRCKRNAGFAK